MPFSATLPVASMNDANAELEAQGFGIGNFSVPLRDGAAEATHAGFHAWDDPAFRAAVDALDYPGLVVTDATDVQFDAHCRAQALEWSDPSNWFQNPVMTGDRRERFGKIWESLIDWNVWEPPVGYREIVSEGYPDFVQPTGAHNAYSIGDRMTFEGTVYESTINGNVWSPTAYPAVWSAPKT